MEYSFFDVLWYFLSLVGKIGFVALCVGLFLLGFAMMAESQDSRSPILSFSVGVVLLVASLAACITFAKFFA